MEPNRAGSAPEKTPAPTDERLAELAVAGDRQALEDLLRRHQRFLYNVAFRMLQRPEDAEDATQEALLRIATRLATFRGESAFRTWACRIAVNGVLDFRRSRPEQAVAGFGCYADYLARAPDEGPADLAALPADERMVIEEARLSCMMGVLLCLDRGQRVAYVLGEILELGDTMAGEVLGIAPDAFRQRLLRARQQLQGFLRGQCGLVDSANACRCARKTRTFVRDGIVDPARLVFLAPHLERVREASARGRVELEPAAAEVVAALYREHPYYRPRDLAARVRASVEAGPLHDVLQLG